MKKSSAVVQIIMPINEIFWLNISRSRRRKSCTSRGQLRKTAGRSCWWSLFAVNVLWRGRRSREKGLMKWNETDSNLWKADEGNSACVLLWEAATLQHLSNLERMAPLRPHDTRQHQHLTELVHKVTRKWSYILLSFNLIYHCDTLWTHSIVEFKKKCTAFTEHISTQQRGDANLSLSE